MSSNSGEQLKAIVILVLGGIAALALFPYASGSAFKLEDSSLYVSLGCASAVVLVILSDMLTSLEVTCDFFELQLESIK